MWAKYRLSHYVHLLGKKLSWFKTEKKYNLYNINITWMPLFVTEFLFLF